MNINIRLNKNFTSQFNKLSDKYGEELAYLNGFGDNQLSYTDFIDNFIDKNTVADASVDSNSNVSHKDIVTLEREMPKPHSKLIAANKIFYEIQKKYGFKTACDWFEAEWIGQLYMHDFCSASYRHYCVYPKECCTFILNGKYMYCSLEDIYDLIDAPEQWDIIQNVKYKIPVGLKVLDYDVKNKKFRYTKVTMVSKKDTEKDFYFVKTYNGANLITTEDHKYITDSKDTEAKDLIIHQTPLYSDYDDNVFTCTMATYNGLPLTSDIGYLVGMYIAEGYNNRGQLTICQNPGKELDKIIKICDKYGIEYKRYQYKDNHFNSHVELLRLKNGIFGWEKKILKIVKGKYCYDKRLCPDFTHFNEEFLKGMLAGIIDGDGTISQNSLCMIRMTSRTLVNQIRHIGLHFGVFFGSRVPYIQSQNAKIVQKRPMHSANVNMNRNKDFFLSLDSIKIKEQYTNFEYNEKMANKNYVCEFGEIKARDVVKTYKPTNEVIDLSTESHTFLCNDILIHNCFAYDLKDLAEKGLYFIDGQNPKPAEHLSTFVDFVKEFVSFACNRSSGAVGLPNLIPYMFYFWKKDIKDNYVIRDPEYYAKQSFQRFIYAVNQPYVRDGSQSAFTNTSVFDRPYFEALFGGSTFPDGTYMIDYEDEIIEFQKWYMEVMSDIRSHNMFTFPVSTISLLRKKGEYPLDSLDGFVDPEFAEWAIKHNTKWSDSNFFLDTSVDSLSNCCRLKSSIGDLGYFNSIGGTALKVGSVKVSTINLARIALDTKTEEEYLEELKRRTLLNLQALDVVRNIIRRNVEKGLLPNFTYNLVDFEHLYNTIGFIGIYETMKKFKYTTVDEFGNTYYTDKASEFGDKIFKTMRQVTEDFLKEINADYKVSTEQIPGESSAAKLMLKDKYFYPKAKIYDLPLYGNQFIPLGIKTTLQERVRIQALFDGFCNGGSILHANISAPFDSYEKALRMTNYIAQQGVTYSAFNTKIQACKNNHAFYGKICPVCGEPVESEYTRIVGFYTKIKSWSKERKAEYGLRCWEDINKTAEETK